MQGVPPNIRANSANLSGERRLSVSNPFTGGEMLSDLGSPGDHSSNDASPEPLASIHAPTDSVQSNPFASFIHSSAKTAVRHIPSHSRSKTVSFNTMKSQSHARNTSHRRNMTGSAVDLLDFRQLDALENGGRFLEDNKPGLGRDLSSLAPGIGSDSLRIDRAQLMSGHSGVVRSAVQQIPPPQGPFVSLFTSRIEKIGVLEQELTSEQFTSVRNMYIELIADCMDRYAGYIWARTGVDRFYAAFEEAHEAIRCAINLQKRLNDAKWPPFLFEIEDTSHRLTYAGSSSDHGMFRGIRVAMAVHTGELDATQNPYTQTPEDFVMERGVDSVSYRGSFLKTLEKICERTNGGQILVSSAAHIGLITSKQANPDEMSVLEVGKIKTGHDVFVDVVEITPSSLKFRSFPNTLDSSDDEDDDDRPLAMSSLVQSLGTINNNEESDPFESSDDEKNGDHSSEDDERTFPITDLSTRRIPGIELDGRVDAIANPLPPPPAQSKRSKRQVKGRRNSAVSSSSAFSNKSNRSNKSSTVGTGTPQPRKRVRLEADDGDHSSDPEREHKPMIKAPPRKSVRVKKLEYMRAQSRRDISDTASLSPTPGSSASGGRHQYVPHVSKQELQYFDTKPPDLPPEYDNSYDCLVCKKSYLFQDGVWRCAMWPYFDCCKKCHARLKTNRLDQISDEEDQPDVERIDSAMGIMRHEHTLREIQSKKSLHEIFTGIHRELGQIIEELTEYKLKRLKNIEEIADANSESLDKALDEATETEREITEWRAKRQRELELMDERDYNDDPFTDINIIHNRMQDLLRLHVIEGKIWKQKESSYNVSIQENRLQLDNIRSQTSKHIEDQMLLINEEYDRARKNTIETQKILRRATLTAQDPTQMSAMEAAVASLQMNGAEPLIEVDRENDSDSEISGELEDVYREKFAQYEKIERNLMSEIQAYKQKEEDYQHELRLKAHELAEKEENLSQLYQDYNILREKHQLVLQERGDTQYETQHAHNQVRTLEQRVQQMTKTMDVMSEKLRAKDDELQKLQSGYGLDVQYDDRNVRPYNANMETEHKYVQGQTQHILELQDQLRRFSTRIEEQDRILDDAKQQNDELTQHLQEAVTSKVKLAQAMSQQIESLRDEISMLNEQIAAGPPPRETEKIAPIDEEKEEMEGDYNNSQVEGDNYDSAHRLRVFSRSRYSTSEPEKLRRISIASYADLIDTRKGKMTLANKTSVEIERLRNIIRVLSRDLDRSSGKHPKEDDETTNVSEIHHHIIRRHQSEDPEDRDFLAIETHSDRGMSPYPDEPKTQRLKSTQSVLSEQALHQHDAQYATVAPSQTYEDGAPVAPNVYRRNSIPREHAIQLEQQRAQQQNVYDQRYPEYHQQSYNGAPQSYQVQVPQMNGGNPFSQAQETYYAAQSKAEREHARRLSQDEQVLREQLLYESEPSATGQAPRIVAQPPQRYSPAENGMYIRSQYDQEQYQMYNRQQMYEAGY